MKTLVRETYIPNKIEEDYNEELYVKMQDFGYNIPIKEKQKNQLKDKYLKFLNEINIPPFTQESIQKYKDWISTKGDVISIIIIISTMVLSLLISNIIFTQHKFSTLNYLVGNSLTILFSFCISFMFCGFLGLYDTIKWKIVRIECYRDRIPEFAMQTCIDIAEEAKKYNFGFNFCICYSEKIKDPFLIVCFDDCDEFFYVEVWNEPGFKQIKEI